MPGEENKPGRGAGGWRLPENPENRLFGPRGVPVKPSSELNRVLALPRRPVVTEDSATADALIEIAQSKYSRGPRECKCQAIDPKRPCITRLLWIQAWMLHEITIANGLIGNVPVGAGKTNVGILAPLALRNCPTCLLMIPPTLVDQIKTDYLMLAEHFIVPRVYVHEAANKTWKPDPHHVSWTYAGPILHVFPYSGLSGTKNSDWIERLKPDAIICDEVDAIKDLSSSRSLRILRYFEEFGDTTRFCGWTGSMTDKSVVEFAHLAAFALREASPMPVDGQIIAEWGRCLDAVPNPSPPGALLRFLEPQESKSISSVRRAFRRRLKETSGFILVEGSQTIVTAEGEKVQLDIRERKAPVIPDIIEEALIKVRDFTRPDTLAGNEDDEILVDPMEQVKCAREVASGFFYRFVFVNGESKALIREWYAARKLYNGELRLKVLRGESQLDSPSLCEAAARRYYEELPPHHPVTEELLPQWASEHWPRWRDVKDKVQPKQEAVRLHPYLVEDAAQWGLENRGIIWYGMIEFAQWVRELSGLPIHDGGKDAGKRIMAEKGDRSIIASIKSHARGRDRLQYVFNHQLIAQMLASARMWQQLLGRLHRRGQKQGSVITECYLHTPELESALDQAMMRGEFVEQTMGEGQKLLEGWHD